MKKLVSVLVLLAILASGSALAEALLPYAGEEVVYKGYTADLGLTENRESPVYKAYSALLGNVSIEWSSAPWGDFDSKTSLFLNTGDLPDIVWLRKSSDVVANYGGLGYFLNFKDYLDYMPNLKSYLETYPQIANMATEDGALYCLNDIEPNDYVDESFFVNTTALKKLGKEIPTTWDEMLDCMRAYKKENPNGNAFITYGWGAGYYMYALGAINNAKTGFYFDGEKWTHSLLNEDSGYHALIDMMHSFLNGYTDSATRKEAGVGNIMDIRYIQYKNREVDYVGGTDASRAAYDKIIGGLISGDLIGIRALRGKPAFTAEQNEVVARNVTPFTTYIDENVMYFIDGTRSMSEWDAFVEETLALGDMDAVLAAYEEAEQVIYSTERRYVSYN